MKVYMAFKARKVYDGCFGEVIEKITIGVFDKKDLARGACYFQSNQDVDSYNYGVNDFVLNKSNS